MDSDDAAPKWITFPGRGAVDGVHVEFLEHAAPAGEPRVEIVGLYLTGRGLNSGALRQIQLGRLESTIENLIAAHGPAPVTKKHERTIDYLKAQAKNLNDWKDSFGESSETKIGELLTRKPDDAPDDFWERVAAAYQIATSITRSPAVLMAEQAGVADRTAHYWIREARRHNHLPAGRKGRAG